MIEKFPYFLNIFLMNPSLKLHLVKAKYTKQNLFLHYFYTLIGLTSRLDVCIMRSERAYKYALEN